VRVRVEKKYVELWQKMNLPVLLLFYHPDTRAIYWKSVQDYLKCDPGIIKKGSDNVVFPFDKARDLFTVDVLNSLRQVVEGEFKYDKIIYTEDSKEEVLSNWFSVLSLPNIIYSAPTPYKEPKDIYYQIQGYYSFIIKSNRVFTFSALTDPNCELRNFCDYSEDVLEVHAPNEIEENWYVELLNRMLSIYAWKNMIVPTEDRFYFSPKVLDNEATARFEYKPLIKEKETSRFKIYINKTNNMVEYKHMAVKLGFIRLGSKWYFQIEPGWHFSYPTDETKTRKEIGIKITKEKAGTFNEHYLYLLHAWKQFLSNSSDTIVFHCDDLQNSQVATISTANESFVSNFLLFNDYFGPKQA
jgi:hypothetical protein